MKTYANGLVDGKAQIDSDPYARGFKDGKKIAIAALREATFGSDHAKLSAAQKLARIRDLAEAFEGHALQS